MRMVDWGTQDRLYPSGYRSVNVRYQSAKSSSKGHSCRSQSKQDYDHSILFDGLQQSIDFYRKFSEDHPNDKQNPLGSPHRNGKMIAMYPSRIHWPRSVCCLTENDGSVIVCEEEQCRLIHFSSRLMLLSTYGGTRGNGLDQFDSPWSVAAGFDRLKSNVLVTDSNNRRVLVLTIGFQGQFRYQYSVSIKEKPFFIAISREHFAVSCEKSLIYTFRTDGRIPIATIDLNQIFPTPKLTQIAFSLCLNPENSVLFVSNPIASTNTIEQLNITGEYLRTIKFVHQPFLHISSFTFDHQTNRLVIADSMNSIIYSIDYQSDENNIEILLKRSDNVNYPQGLCLTNEGHLILVECSVLTQHSLKIFRYRSSRLTTSSIKTSETTSVRSMIDFYSNQF